MSSSFFKAFRSSILALSFLASASTLFAADANDVAKFKAGDRVCFIGDSITHGGGFNYHSQIVLFYATRFPEMRFQSWSCGISGDSASGAVRRYDWDIAPLKPTISTIMLGMNDVWRDNYGTDKTGPEFEEKHKKAIDIHVENMTKLAERLSKDGSALIFITPSIYDQTGTQKTKNLFGVNDALKICGDEARKLAAQNEGDVVDFHSLMTRINAEVQAKNPDDTIVGGDRVHPGAPGHLIMAYAFLKAQGMTPTVSKIAIDAKKGIASVQDNCKVSKLEAKSGAVSFEALENALPFPVDDSAKKALELVPLVQDLDQETLAVSGLEDGSYELLIDGQSAGKFSSAELKDGVNLALNKATPQYKQALKVQALLKERADIYASKLRTFAAVKHFTLSKLTDQSPEAIQKCLEEQLEKSKEKKFAYGVMQIETYMKFAKDEEQLKQKAAELLDKAYSENKPQLHSYELKKAL